MSGAGAGLLARLAAPAIARRAAWALTALFFAVGLATLPHYGATWDEQESYAAGRGNLELVAALFGDDATEWPWHELKGYQFLLDTGRAAVALPVNALLGRPAAALPGHRVSNLLLAAIALLLVFEVGCRASADGLAALLAAATLALLPKFLAHSQNNPKDLPGLVVIALGVLAIEDAARRAGWRPALALGAVLGVAVANHVAALVLVPFAGLWILAQGRTPRAARWRTLALAAATAPVAFLAAWPWLWGDPLSRLAAIVHRVRTFPVKMPVLYLGRLYADSQPPWHYTLVGLLVSTPLLVLVLVAAGAPAALGGDHGRRRLARLALLWGGLLLLAEGLGAAHYDGVRHVLAALPALALVAGLGLAAVLRRLAAGVAGPRRRGALLLAALLALAGVATVAQLVAIHPYHDAYLAEPVRAVVAPHAEEVFELEYWGHSYREGARWLKRHAERGAAVLVPIAAHAAAPFLRPDLELVAGDRLRDGAGRAAYLMLMTRRAWYTPAIDRVRAERRPVFTVRRQRSTLLEIYRLHGPDHRILVEPSP